MSAGVGSPTRSDRIPALDAIRGVAIVSVVATHAFNASTRAVGTFVIPPEIAALFAAGRFGVQLFFVLSGWLMFALYSGADNFGGKAYWARRLGRVWPLWSVFILIYFALGWVDTDGLSLPAAFISCLLFLTWLYPALSSVPLGGISIVLEMFHYVLFARFRRASSSVLAGTVIALVLVWFVARGVESRSPEGSLIHSVAQAWVNLGLEQSWPFFLLGGACFMLFQGLREGGSTFAPPHIRWQPLLISSLAVASLLVTADGSNEPIWVGLGFVVVTGSLAVLANGIPVVGAVLRRVGLYSYFIYFAHVFVLLALEWLYPRLRFPQGEDVGLAWALFVLVAFTSTAVIVSSLLGVISWRIFESPILGYLKKRFPSTESRIQVGVSKRSTE
jgi:peptidoglycan/LPS O-acetylase OafA/YrhL